MPAGVEFVRVRRGRSRVHLAAAVTAGRPVHTLCGRELTDAEVTDALASCELCLRRKDDAAVVSSAFFNEEAGSRLLELSLEAARRRREGRPDLRVLPPAAPPRPSPPQRGRGPRADAEASAPPPPTRRGELNLEGMRQFSEDVYVTPGGVIVRMEGDRIAEVTGQAAAQLTRTPDGLHLQLGDLRVDSSAGRLAARVAQ